MTSRRYRVWGRVCALPPRELLAFRTKDAAVHYAAAWGLGTDREAWVMVDAGDGSPPRPLRQSDRVKMSQTGK